MAGFDETVRRTLSPNPGDLDRMVPLTSSSLLAVRAPEAHEVNSKRLARALRARHRSAARSMATTLFARLRGTAALDGLGAEDASASSSDSDSSSDEHEDADSSSSASTPKAAAGVCSYTWRLMEDCMPLLSWGRSINLKSLQADVIAGLTVCVMVIPQSMSYAKIAGLPYQFGMYSACVPPLVYALFGQSRQLAVGPVAMTSLILRAGLTGKLSEEQCPQWYADDSDMDTVYQNELCTEQYCLMAFSVAAMVGIILIVASIFQLGFLVSFLGHPVISGFSTGAALIIGLSQLKYFLGVKLPNTHNVAELLLAVVESLSNIKVAPLMLGIVWLAFLIGLKKLAQKKAGLRFIAPLGPLIACVFGTALVTLLPALHDVHSVATVGDVPAGLFPFSGRQLEVTWDLFDKIKITAISVALIGFMESIAISKNLAQQHGYEISAGQELLALGSANLVGALFSGYCVTGSFSRSAVSNTTGAKTQLAGVITGLSMLLVLLLLTPAFHNLPMFALAAVVMSSVLSLIAYDVAIELWHVKRWDFALWVAAFIGTLFIGPLEGIGIAVAMSIAVVIYESVRPQLTVLWRLPGTKIYRSIDQDTTGRFVPNVLIVRLGASLYFANCAYVKDGLLRFMEDMFKEDEVKYVILEMSSVRSIDSTASHLFKDIVTDFQGRGVKTAFAMVHGRVMATLRRAKLTSAIGEDMFFYTVDDAVRECQRDIASAFLGGSDDADDTDVNGCARMRSMTRVSFSTAFEVGISNEIHPRFTQVHISVPHVVTGLVSIITGVFVANSYRVEGAQVDHTHHTYQIVKAEKKLTSAEVEALRSRLRDVIGSLFDPEKVGAEGASSPAALSHEKTASSVNRDIDAGGSQDVAEVQVNGLRMTRPALEKAMSEERAKVISGELARERMQALEAALSMLRQA